MSCRFDVDGQPIQASERQISNKIDSNIAIFSYCESSVTVPVSAGDHDVDLFFDAITSLPDPERATLTAMFIPFDGTGATP